MPLLADRVRETSATTGTGTLTLAGAVAGYQGFNAAFANADTVYYVIQYATEWEVGIGTVGTGTLSRDSVLASSNADALVPFSAGTKDVFVAYVAGRAVTTSDAATLTNKTIDDITNLVGADHIHYKIKANATITKGQTLKAVGYNAGAAAIEVEPISSASDIAVGIAYQDLASGAFGAAINTGLLIGVKTDFAGWALGDVLFPDPATGGLTKTKPTSGTYQACAYIMRVQSNNGVLLCEFTEPQQVLASTATANTAVLRDGSGNFAAGTVTAALTGNASTATTLQTARNINGVSFNGSADITVTAAAGTLSGSTLASGVTASSLTSVGTLTSLAVSGNGKFGAGVAANSARLMVNTPSGTAAGIQLFQDSVESWIMECVPSVAALRWTQSGTEQMRLTSGGLGLNTASPAARLDVTGVFNGLQARFGNTAGRGLYVSTALNGGTNEGSTVLDARGASSGQFLFQTDSVTRATLDASGNLGLGVTPSAWDASFRALQIGSVTPFAMDNSGAIGLNYFYDGAYKYVGNSSATLYSLASGQHRWFTAPSGSAGNAISFVQDMTLSGGNLGVGTTSINVGGWGRAITLQGSANAAYEVTEGTVRTVVYASGGSIGGIGTETNHPLTFSTNGTERARIDASGNLGLGVTPSAWSGFTALDVGVSSAALATAGGTADITLNAYNNSGWKYKGTGEASFYRQQGGIHYWFTAPSGTAGNAISFTQMGTLTSTGLGLGASATSPGQLLTLRPASGNFYTSFVGDATATMGLLFGTSGNTVDGQVIYSNSTQVMSFVTASAERARIPAAGGMVVGTAALATAATDGFLYVPTCAGTPTGTPTTQTGTAPIIVDTTNHKLYFFSGGTWRDAGP